VAELNIAIIASRFNPEITGRLLAGAQEALRGVADVTVIHVPGAFEIPLAAKHAALSRRFDGIVTIGCVIRGETAHFEYISNAATLGISQAGLETGVPVTFGVLTTETDEQALARSAPGPDNKGFHAAQSVLEMVRVLRELK
jgi:6,7-dimethyl-8-ribityllumazine synthase